MEKGTHVSDIYETARRLHAANIQVGFFLQFGYPGETLEDVKRRAAFSREDKGLLRDWMAIAANRGPNRYSALAARLCAETDARPNAS